MNIKFKYNVETTEYIRSEYLKNPVSETIYRLSEEFNVPVRSIIGKLSKEGVYKKPTYVNKAGERPITKDELVKIIETLCEEVPSSFEGLEKAPKKVLRTLILNLGGDYMLQEVISCTPKTS